MRFISVINFLKLFQTHFESGEPLEFISVGLGGCGLHFLRVSASFSSTGVIVLE